MFDFESLTPNELTVISTLLTFLVADEQNADDLNVLGNFIVSIGSLILTWAAQMQLLERAKQSTEDNTASFEDIKKQIKTLQDKCDRLEKNGLIIDEQYSNKSHCKPVKLII